MENICEICEERPLTIKCLDCIKNIYYCEKCYLSSHGIDIKKAHRTAKVNVRDAVAPKHEKEVEYLCIDHNRKKKYVCKTCKVTVCSDCYNISPHKGHDLTTFFKAAQYINELRDNSLRTYNETFIEVNNSLREEI